MLNREERRGEVEGGEVRQKTNTMHACGTLFGVGVGVCLRVWGLLLGSLRLGGFSFYNQTPPPASSCPRLGFLITLRNRPQT